MPMLKQTPVEEALDIAPSSVIEDNQIIVLSPEADANSDFDYARDNIRLAIEAGIATLSDMKTLVDQSQHPKMYEAYISMLKTVVDSNKSLLETRKLQKQIERLDAPETPTHVQNNLFVGTTADFQQMLEDEQD